MIEEETSCILQQRTWELPVICGKSRVVFWGVSNTKASRVKQFTGRCERKAVSITIPTATETWNALVLLGRQRVGRSVLEFLGVLGHERGVDLDLRRLEGRSSNKFKVRVANELPRQPQEGLFKVVVGLGRDVVVLQVLQRMGQIGTEGE